MLSTRSPVAAASAAATATAAAAAAPATASAAAVEGTWLESMIPIGMGQDSWYLVHAFSPSFLVKALSLRDRESGLTMTIRSRFSALIFVTNCFISSLIFFGKDCVALRPAAFLTVFSKKILLSLSAKRSFTGMVQ